MGSRGQGGRGGGNARGSVNPSLLVRASSVQSTPAATRLRLGQAKLLRRGARTTPVDVIGSYAIQPAGTALDMSATSRAPGAAPRSSRETPPRTTSSWLIGSGPPLASIPGDTAPLYPGELEQLTLDGNDSLGENRKQQRPPSSKLARWIAPLSCPDAQRHFACGARVCFRTHVSWLSQVKPSAHCPKLDTAWQLSPEPGNLVQVP